MDEQHKQALAEGRHQGRVVRRYLDLLDITKPKRGRKVNVEDTRLKIKKLEEELEGIESSFDQLQTLQELEELREKADRAEAAETAHGEMADAEAEFIKVALKYSQNKGITKAVWREIGVPADVLKQAGITAASVR